MDEAFYVVDGGGIVGLVDERHPIDRGATVFIPKNSWHGFENTDRELTLLWVVAPPGLEAFFREVAVKPGAPPTSRTKAQLNEIARARRHATEFK